MLSWDSRVWRETSFSPTDAAQHGSTQQSCRRPPEGAASTSAAAASRFGRRPLDAPPLCLSALFAHFSQDGDLGGSCSPSSSRGPLHIRALRRLSVAGCAPASRAHAPIHGSAARDRRGRRFGRNMGGGFFSIKYRWTGEAMVGTEDEARRGATIRRVRAHCRCDPKKMRDGRGFS